MEVNGGQPGGRKPLRRLIEARQDLIASQRHRARIAREVLAHLPQLRHQQATQRSAADAGEAEVKAALASDAAAPRPDVAAVPSSGTDSPTAAGDQIELSASIPIEDPAREERVQELREQFEAGTLNTPERLEQAAEGLLGSTS